MKVSFMSLSLAATLILVACGSSTPNGSLPGGGTQTLLVSAEIQGENRVDNAGDASAFDTRFEVVIKRAGQTVTDARVVLRSSSGERVLSLQGDKYKGGHVGYDRYYYLDVTSGADQVREAMIAGPSLHRIASPLPGATVPAGQDLQIAWSRDEAADTASVETKRFKLDSTVDRGSLLVPGSYLPGKVGETQPDEVKVRRTNRVGLAGGIVGSEIRATVRNQVATFLVAPLP